MFDGIFMIFDGILRILDFSWFASSTRLNRPEQDAEKLLKDFENVKRDIGDEL